MINKKIMTALLAAAVMLSAAGCSSSGKKEDKAENSKAAETSSAEEVKEPRNIKLMCLGDSITDGFWLPGGYRNTLGKMLEDNDQSQYVDFVGKRKCGDLYDNECEGYTGYAIEGASGDDCIDGGRQGIATLLPKLLEKDQPDLILLQIGTNDILSLYALDTAGERLGKLVDTCLEALPEDGKLCLATIPDMDANDTTYIDPEHFTPESMDGYVAAYNEQVKQVAQERKDAGKNIELCDVNSVLTKEDLYDGVHPNEEGYKKLGEFWYGYVSEFLTNY